MEEAAARRTPGFAQAVQQAHVRRAECPEAVLFELRPGRLDGAVG